MRASETQPCRIVDQKHHNDLGKPLALQGLVGNHLSGWQQENQDTEYIIKKWLGECVK
jgi:hypothetical protein